MSAVARVRFPCTPQVSGLYFKVSDAGYTMTADSVDLQQDATLSFNTYFNSFYESFYLKYTRMRAGEYRLRLEGSFLVSFYRERFQCPRERLGSVEFHEAVPDKLCAIALPSCDDPQAAGRIYLELRCLSRSGRFLGGELHAVAAQPRPVSLAIVICTYKREAYLDKTVRAILDDRQLGEKDLSIYVVDNAQTVGPFDDPRVRVFPNPNYGGSGGFSRGLLEARQRGDHTHFLLMDDDIQLDSEAVFRAVCLFEHADESLILSGSMLDSLRSYSLFEAGAVYGVRPDLTVRDPLMWAPLKTNLFLQDSKDLNYLLVEEHADYGAFWFFAGSMALLDKIGLVFPFFIRVDDIEFSLRAQAAGHRIVPFPSLGVWHDSFAAKKPVWDEFYTTRNVLICNAIHRDIPRATTLTRLGKRFNARLFGYDYNAAHLILDAIEHFLEGPAGLLKRDPEELAAQVKARVERYPVDAVPAQDASDAFWRLAFYRRDYKLATMALSLATLNGHLLPESWVDEDGTGHITDDPYSTFKAFGKRNALSLHHYTRIARRRLNTGLGRKLFARWLRLSAQGLLRWKSVEAAWREQAPQLVSATFWRRYLRLDARPTARPLAAGGPSKNPSATGEETQACSPGFWARSDTTSGRSTEPPAETPRNV